MTQLLDRPHALRRGGAPPFMKMPPGPHFHASSRLLLLSVLILFCGSVLAAEAQKPVEARAPKGRVFYVRLTVGDDSNDGLSAEKAWRSISKLSDVMQAGDTAYVGPGLYRDEIQIHTDGTPEKPIALIADPTGKRTGDPPGVVMIAGSDPVDESIFVAGPVPGVYQADSPEHPVGGVVEMDGPQYRYFRAESTKEHLADKMSEVDVVAKLPSTYFYDEHSKVVYLHTSDGKPPWAHEIELIHRSDGITALDKHFVIVVGFTVRHTGDSGIRFWIGSGDGIAINNTSYGCRQGIRVYSATNVLVSGNTLFRNENCGVYFAKDSVNGIAVGNTLYENVKGIRWSSASSNGLAAGNVAFDNLEAGISIENADNIRVIGNRIVNNKLAQLLEIESRPLSDGNCFKRGAPGELIADLSFFEHYETLTAYQRGALRDQGSREGRCGRLPRKINVHKLHEKTMRYAERARRILARTHGARPQKSRK